jgi:hypothetical protein
MATGLRASCGDMDLPASMDQAVRTELAQAACGALTGDGLKFLDPDASDRARAPHDGENLCLGGICFEQASASEAGDPGQTAERMSPASGGGGSGGGGGAGGGGSPHGAKRSQVSPSETPFDWLAPPFSGGVHPAGGAARGGPAWAGVPPLRGDLPGGEGDDGTTATPFAVSEPTTLMLLGVGLVAAALATRRIRARRA